MQSRANIVFGLLAVAFVLASDAPAAVAVNPSISTYPLFNTGVDNNYNRLPNGTLGDPHYSLISIPDSTQTTTLRIRTAAGGAPINNVGKWLGDTNYSTWIGPNNSSSCW